MTTMPCATLPSPSLVASAQYRAGGGVNDRCTGVPSDAGTMPVQSSVANPPPQPSKLELASGFAISSTEAPGDTTMLHAPGQSIPAGLEVTLPAPRPIGFTTICAPVLEKVAVTWVFCESVRSQAPVPEHPP